MHELTELILGQPLVGTTIKTDGIESDPLALLTVLNMHLHHVCYVSPYLFFGGLIGLYYNSKIHL